MKHVTAPTTAVPLKVQRVLDAMTEENWRQDGWFDPADGRMCFMHRAVHLDGRIVPKMTHDMEVTPPSQYLHLLDDGDSVFCNLDDRCRRRYLRGIECTNDDAFSLSDFKAKVTALYQNGGQ